MSSSPDSDASSSDLYSASERAGEDGSHQLVGISSIDEGSRSPEERISHAQSVSAEVGGLSESHPNGITREQGLRNAASWSPPNRAILGGQDHPPHPKRKREDDEETLQTFQDQHTHPEVPDYDQGSSRTISLDSVQQPMAQTGGSLGNDRSKIKRPRMEDHIDPISDGNSQAKPAGLPVEIWQHIFSFVPPVFLGRLLRVNRAFHVYLTSASRNQARAELGSLHTVQPVSADDVWAASRKRFAPGLPKPTLGLSELERMRLLRGRQCQICGEVKVQNFATSSESPLESGPGDKGVRVIWPFGVRSCGPCLHKCSEKESALFVSPECPYFLLSALPFAFITATNHFVSNAALQGMAHLPPLKMEKHYYKPHIEDIKRRLDEARSLGAASAEEWCKGLDAEGNARIDDATRWEQWEFKGGLKKINLRPPPKALAEPVASRNGINSLPSKGEVHSGKSTPQLGPVSARPSSEYGASTASAPMDPAPQTISIAPHFQPPRPTLAPYTDGFPQRPASSFPLPRPERNIRDVNEAKAIRKAEIERRCGELDPPLSSNVLNHMDSFHAAIQISQPLTDHAWEVLKPRLLAQRPFAEKKEEEKIRQDELLQEEYQQRRQQEVQLKETKEALDREWDNVQAPVRSKISALADEIIAQNWSNGDSVSKDTSPKFAADVLIYVRERFYADIAREDEAAKAAGEPVKVDHPNEPPTRKLILENMKWLFDTKIKPLTENYQKELFLCNGCDGNFKFYGFEGVVQHFAAKHTTTLSMGSVVVHWRAEWPDHPPFNPNPSAAKAAYYKIPTPVNPSIQAPASLEVQPPTYYGGYGQSAEHSAPPTAYDSTQPAPNPYPTQYPAPQHNNGYSYPPAQAYQPYSQMPQPEQVQVAPYNPQPMYPAAHPGYNGYPPAQYGQPAGPTYGTPYGQTQYPSFTQSQDYPRSGAYGQDPNSQFYGSSAMTPHTMAFPPRPVPVHPSGLAPDVYQKQLDELAKQAREVWFGTSGIKDIPQSVRIFVVIHQVASRFAATFTNEPSLAMFIDGLDNHAKMRPVRSLNGLACKTCVNAGSSAGIDQQRSTQSAVADRRLYTLPHLLNHFRSAHVDDAYAVKEPSAASDSSKPDWKRDMIELPDLALIANLLNAPGMDDAKLSLVATVFPEAFPNPLPRMARGGNTGPVPTYKQEHASHKAPSGTAVNQPRSFKVENRNEARRFEASYGVAQAPSPQGQSVEAPGEDEYDPHRPAFLGRFIQPEPSLMGRWDDHHHQSSTGTSYPYRNGEPNPSTLRSERLDERSPRTQRDTRYPESPERILGTGFGGQFTESNTNTRKQQRNHDVNKNAYNENSQSIYAQLLQNGGTRDTPTSKQFTVRSTSPSEAADQFLNSFPVANTHNSGSLVQENIQRSGSAWRNEAANQDRQVYDTIGSLERWKGENTAGQLLEDRPTLDSIRAAKSISMAVDDLAVSSQRAASRSRLDEEYRPPSHVEISPAGSRSGSSPQPYEAHGPPRHGYMETQYIAHEVGSRDERAGSYHQTRDPYYRSRSRSPQTSQIERGYYRARSPQDERHQEPFYRVMSPIRQEPQVQRLVRSEYPAQARYRYVEDRMPADDRYGRRVEYLPVRYEGHGSAETGRYVLAQPFEDPAPPPGYVRLEQSYGGQQVFERNGQMYRTEPAGYHPEPYRGSQVYAQEYRY